MTHGAGSSTSPIVISDDEDDEIMDHQLRVVATSKLPIQRVHRDTPVSPTNLAGPETSRKRRASNRYGQLIKIKEQGTSVDIQAASIVADPSGKPSQQR